MFSKGSHNDKSENPCLLVPKYSFELCVVSLWAETSTYNALIRLNRLLVVDYNITIYFNINGITYKN